jgi:hypothetical protein
MSMSSDSGHQLRFVCPRLPPVNGHLPALSSVFVSMFLSDRSMFLFVFAEMLQPLPVLEVE